MIFAPEARMLPLTVRAAVPLAPETVAGAVPSRILPSANDMLPVGAAVPDPAFTVAVRTVDELGAIVTGLAVTVVVVTIGALTVNVTGAEVEPLKVPFPP